MNNKLKEAIAVVDEVLNDPIIGCDVTVMQEQALLTLISLAKASLEVELPEKAAIEEHHYQAERNKVIEECRPILAGYRARIKKLEEILIALGLSDEKVWLAGVEKYTKLEANYETLKQQLVSIKARILAKPDKENKVKTLHRIVCAVVNDCEQTGIIVKNLREHLLKDKE